MQPHFYTRIVKNCRRYYFYIFFLLYRFVLQKSFLACTKGPPTPSPANECVSPIGPKGGVTLACGRQGGGTQFGRLERKHGTLYTLWLRLWAGRQWKRQSSWTQWTSTPSAPLPQPSPRSRLLLVQGQSENFAFNFSIKDSTLQRKSHLCILFLGIARPQSKFPHSCVCERFILYIPRIGPHIFLQQNRQTEIYKSLTDIWV